MLTGKTALITGSTSGIGAGIAARFADLGATVLINGFGDTDVIAEQLADLQARGAKQVAHFGTDMSKPDQIETMIAEAQERFGTIDILVNNAGIQHVAPVEDFPVEKWDAITAINLTSAFHTTRLVIRGMKAQRWGRIINMASAHSLVASPFKSAYVAAKHGLVGLTKSTALECAADGVTVNAISPGYVLTPLVQAQIPDTARARGISEDAVIRDVMLANQPTKEFVGIDEIAGTAAFLCSDDAKSITGSNLSIDGGWVAQ